MTRKKLTIILLFVLAFFSAGVFAHEFFKPKIIWSSSEISLPSLKPGTAVTTNATLMSGRELENVSLQITAPEGVSISSKTKLPKELKKGKPFLLLLTVSVASTTSAAPPRVLSGKLHLVQKDSNEKERGKEKRETKVKVLGEALLIKIAISPFDLPPYPNKTEDEATIAGTDANTNGVPDRVEWYIATAVPDSEKKREAMMLTAKAEQTFLMNHLSHLNEDPYDPEVRALAKKADVLRLQAVHCEEYTFGVNDPFLFNFPNGREKWNAYLKVSRELESLYYNTPSRLKNFKDAEKPLVATGDIGVPPEQYGQECLDLGFNPDNLPN